jgi:hypothetical protein
MRCLYCGKELALFKRLRGGEFCSDAHRLKYQEEYTQLALNRLLQANSPKDKDSSGVKSLDLKPAEPESPALKRRERLGREDTPAPLPAMKAPLAPAPASIAKPFSVEERPGTSNGSGGAFEQVLGALNQIQQTAVLDPEPAPAANIAAFLVEVPVPAMAEAAEIAGTVTPLGSASRLSLPRLQEFPPDSEDHLAVAGPLGLVICALADFQTPPRERGLELREFVRGVPQVEIRVRPASETGFDPAREPMEVRLAACSPKDPGLWQAFEQERPALGCDSEILLEELARLDFAPAGWEEAEPADASVEQPPAASEIPAAIENARLEPMRVEPIHFDPAARENARMLEEPAPLRFEPVHIDPVFMERIAAADEFAAGFKARKNETETRQTAVVEIEPAAAPEPAALQTPEVLQEDVARQKDVEPQTDVAPQTDIAPPTNEAAALEIPASAEPATLNIPAPEPEAPAPPPPSSITKPVPVTLHGLAPLRGKPVQVFTSAVSRGGEIQIPRETGLPLRPIMVLGTPPPPAAVPPSVSPNNEAKPPATKPGGSIPVPEKRDPRPTEIKPRRSEVRILPVQVKAEAPSRQAARLAEAGKPEPTGNPEALKAAPAPNSKEVPSKEVPSKEIAPKETAPQAAAPPVELKRAAAVPVKSQPPLQSAAPVQPPTPAQPVTPPQPVTPQSVTAEEPDLLGLPKLSYQHSENFWSRLPMVVRLGGIALVLALVIGGVVLTSRGSGASKAPAPAKNEPEVVEAGSALANTGGWAQDWFADRADSRQQSRHVDVLRGTLTLRDYRLVFEGEIEHGALGWVFRAHDKSFYVEKIQVITPGLEPVVGLVHFAVINGQEQARTQVPLHIKAHLDTAYKVRMEVVGNRFTTWVQDQKVDQWTDNQIDAGGVGLYYDGGDSAKLRDTLNVIPLRQK